MIIITRLAAAAVAATVCMTFPVLADEQAGVAPMEADTVQVVRSPETVNVGFVGPELPGQESASYTDKDLYILAHVICGEAQPCPDEEQLYVGSVVLNRMNSDQYPDTIEGVVFQRGQYACIRDGNYYREPTTANWANAKWLLENGSVLPGNVVYQSGARQGRGVYLRTAYHYYCY